ncbi:hypothetical protein IWX90DRAFT_65344 [Phyllosticta citrichinensis]|uniref:Uncharacterized protein n=1 Tax=Phyllosticta citrichinensis TaxID=1130410 RepID=A0ABR1XHL7_9PEZI
MLAWLDGRDGIALIHGSMGAMGVVVRYGWSGGSHCSESLPCRFLPLLPAPFTSHPPLSAFCFFLSLLVRCSQPLPAAPPLSYSRSHVEVEVFHLSRRDEEMERGERGTLYSIHTTTTHKLSSHCHTHTHTALSIVSLSLSSLLGIFRLICDRNWVLPRWKLKVVLNQKLLCFFEIVVFLLVYVLVWRPERDGVVAC